MAAEPKELAKVEPSQSGAALAGYEHGALDLQTDNVGALSAIAREQSEIQAAVILARRFPRDEADAYDHVMASCQRPAFAAKPTCVWDFPRGGKKLSGPGVALAREMARHWGHIQYAIRIVSQDEDTVHIAGFAYDCQTNTRVTMEDSFKKLIYRKKDGWIMPDERDLRELINRRGAICVRNAILQVLPPDLTEDAVDKVRETRRKAAKGDIGQKWDQAKRALTVAFREHGVTTEMLEKHLGHNLDEMKPDELVELRGIYGSLADGNTKPRDHFEDARKPDDSVKTDAEIEAGLRKKPETPQPAPTAPEPPGPPPAAEKPVDAAPATPAVPETPIGRTSDLYGAITKAFDRLKTPQRRTVLRDLGVDTIKAAATWDSTTANDALDVIETKLAETAT